MSFAASSPVAIVQRYESRSESEVRLVIEARACMESCNWRLGELALSWIKETGKTDSEFGEQIGLSRKQIQQRRAVWEKFGGNPGSRFMALQPRLTWSHFREALAWDSEEAFECLSWAADAEATRAEMRAWRAAQRGEDLFAAVADNPDRIDDDVPESPPPGELQGVSPPIEPSSPSRPNPPNPPTKTRAGVAAPRPKGGVTPQPKAIDLEKFDVLEAVERARSAALDMAAEFVAAGRTQEFIHCLRTVINDLSQKGGE